VSTISGATSISSGAAASAARFGVDAGIAGWGYMPAVADVSLGHRVEGKPQIAYGARDRTGDGHQLRADQSIRGAEVHGGNPSEGGANSVNAAGIGRIADRSADIRAVPDRADSRRHRRAGAAGGPAGREVGVPGVSGVAVQGASREPAQAERGHVRAPHDNGPRFPEVRDERAVLRRDHGFLEPEPVGRGMAGLIHVHLNGHRDTGHGTGVVARRQRAVDAIRGGEGFRGHLANDRVDRRINLGEPIQNALRHGTRGQSPRANRVGDGHGAHAPRGCIVMHRKPLSLQCR
jgi:hypothetical protein